MSANPEDFLSRTAQVDDQSVQPFPNSRKIYVTGSTPDIRVPMREIQLSDTPTDMGGESNPPVTVYDTSGPYTDPDVDIDIRKGLASSRPWLSKRDGIQHLDGLSSGFAKRRSNDPRLTPLQFAHRSTQPLRAKPGVNVTQMHYAKRGIITEEMEYIAIRENMRLQEHRAALDAQAQKTSNAQYSGSIHYFNI